MVNCENPSRSTDKFLILKNKLIQVSRLLSLLWESPLQNLFCLEYLTGTTRLLEIQKELLFSLNNLSICRELPVFLSTEKLLKTPKYSIRVLPPFG